MLIFQIILYLNTEIVCIIYISLKEIFWTNSLFPIYFALYEMTRVTTQNTCSLIIIVKGIALSQKVKSILKLLNTQTDWVGCIQKTRVKIQA